jgi:predicted kinase
MAPPTVIIITGLPCTGKTTLGTRIAATLSLPYIHKDGIKETLFVSLGWKDRPWSKQLSGASYHLLFYFTQILLAAGRSLIVEANFDPAAHTRQFLELKRNHALRFLQILCHAEGAVLQRRFEQRRAGGGRHPGHLDDVLSRELGPMLRRGRSVPLEIGGQVVEVDTTALNRLDTDGLLQAVRSPLQAY